MMRYDVDIDLADFVLGADQFPFLVASQISQIEDAKSMESNERAERTTVFGLVRRILLGSQTSRIIQSRAWQWVIQHNAIGTQNHHFDARDGQAVTGLEGDALDLLRREQILIGLPDLRRGCVCAFSVIAVIDHLSHGESRDQLGKTACVIPMKRCQQDVVHALSPF